MSGRLTTRIPVTEAQAQRAVVELLELHGWQCLKTEEDRFRGIPGLPDLLCTAPNGMQLWVEMKRPPSSRNPRGHVRKRQKELLAEWRRRGVLCCVADGVTEHLQEIARLGSGECADTERHHVRLTEVAVLSLCDELMSGVAWWPA